MSADLRSIAIGCCPLGGHGWTIDDVEQVVRAVRVSVEAGATTFDTADIYGLGRSEERLADALGSLRHEVRIVTKVGLKLGPRGIVRDGSPAYLRAAVLRSMRRLRIDCIPVVLLHWPDPSTPIETSLGALADLVTEGLIGSYGASNIDPPLRPVPWSQHHVSLVTGPLPSVSRGTAYTMAWGTLEKGLLTDAPRRNLDAGDRRRRDPLWTNDRGGLVANLRATLADASAAIGLPVSALAVRWVLDRGGVDIATVGITSAGQWYELARAIDAKLDAALLDQLDVAAQRLRRTIEPADGA